MKSVLNGITRRLASGLLFASLLVSSLLVGPNIKAQAQTLPPPTGQPTAVSSQPGWEIEFDVSVSGGLADAIGSIDTARAQLVSMLASKALQEKGITLNVSPGAANTFQVSLRGSGDLEALRQLIFTRLAPELDLLSGSIALDLTGPFHKGQTLPVILESRPATGFIWELVPGNSNLVISTQAPVLQSEVSQPSAPSRETLSLKSNMDGEATIHLAYHRPWETEQSVSRRVSIRVKQFPTEIDFSNPVQAEQMTPPVLDAPRVGAAPLAALPAQFDWRQQGKVTPVRDQGTCGSCWAFATVGVMESALMVQAGASTDLSEQFLISCNKQGWGCNGGWWGHDYHMDVNANNQSAAGAVLESDKPYNGTKGTCTADFSHPYKIASWGYVAGSYNSTPSVTQIKNAIYTYGAVAAAVCTGSAWTGYQGGVFATEERNQCSGGGGVNHGILLVGWNDADQTWILRNSWGSKWGEAGYMHIRWGTSNVGFGASYVLVDPPGPPPPPPVNDAFSAAKKIDSPGGPVTYTDMVITRSATNEAADPLFPLAKKIQGSNTVWYQFIPSYTGTVSMNTLGSSYDTLLAVWSGTPGAFKLVKWNDNASASKKQSSLSFNTVKGTSYFVEIGSKILGGGTLAYSLSYKPVVPTNDRLSKSAVIAEARNKQPTSYASLIDVNRATVTKDEPVYADSSRGNRTVWYRFTPAESGALDLSTTGSNYDTVLGIWTKDKTGFHLAASNDDNTTGLQASIHTALLPKVTYYIGISSRAITGPSNLNLSMGYLPQ
jgi:C1A family cysteine protease